MYDIKQLLEEIIYDLFSVSETIDLTRPDEQFGDLSTNIAMKLAKVLGRSPRQVAEQICDKVIKSAQNKIREVSIDGPGFINLRLNDSVLIEQVYLEPKKVYKGMKILVEYSDPNPFKPLHAGHLYTTLVGDAIARLIEVGGAETIRINYGGDVGRHVAMSMWSIIKTIGETSTGLNKVPEDKRAEWLGERYVEGNNAFENSDQAKAEIIVINKRVYELHSSADTDSEFAKTYFTCREWSYQYFEKLYSELSVHNFDRFIRESEVADKGLEVVNQQLGSGVYKSSDGAVIFEGKKYGLHDRVFINSEGLPTYEAKEVGLIYTKWLDYHFNQSIIITASEQEQYMKVVLKSIEQYEPDPVSRTRHITHGVVKLSGGIKMSSRKGNILLAMDVLSAAQSAGQHSQNNSDRDTVLAAVKYAFVKNRIGGDIIYDPEESVALEGNSGPYLQYAHARARSILEKAVVEQVDLSTFVLNVGERSLVRKIGEFSEVVERATIDLAPHLVCTYLYDLAQVFNRFYEQNRVIGDERQQLRLVLVELYANRLKSGLKLIGITAPSRM